MRVKKILVSIMSLLLCCGLMYPCANSSQANDKGWNLNKNIITKQFVVKKNFHANIDTTNFDDSTTNDQGTGDEAHYASDNDGNDDSTNHIKDYAKVNKTASHKLDNYLSQTKNLNDYSISTRSIVDHNTYDSGSNGKIHIYEIISCTFVKKYPNNTNSNQ